MSKPNYEKFQQLSLKGHAELNDNWVQNIIADDTSVLGLGDLVLKDRECIQPRAGRIDLLLQDSDLGHRYIVHPFVRFRSSQSTGIAVARNGVLLLLALFAHVPAGFAQARQEVTEPGMLVNPAAVEFSILPRKPELTYYPCTQCHQFMTPNPEVRKLFSPHPSTLDHGDQRIWCLTCHKIDDRDYLTNLLGENIDFDNAPELCASCHMQRHNDWMSGGHGKRVANWQGERVIYSCPQCHDPHSPLIEARAPKPPPPVRKGLERPENAREAYLSLWERLENRDHE